LLVGVLVLAGIALNVALAKDVIIGHPLIVGGENASVGEFPYQVSIKVWEVNNVSLNMHFCGGFIVDELHVVTAAHCLRDFPVTLMEVVAGASNMKINETTQQYRDLKRGVMHPLYSRNTSSHDAGVITLTEPLVWTEWVQPIPLRPIGSPLRPYVSCVNTGWGSSHPDGISFPLPDVLQKVELVTYPWEVCRAAYESEKEVDESMMCAGNPDEDGHGACSGDSGGPLVCYEDGNAFLAGIVSWGPVMPCGLAEFPGVFADVSNPAVGQFLAEEIAKP